MEEAIEGYGEEGVWNLSYVGSLVPISFIIRSYLHCSLGMKFMDSVA